VTPLSVLEQAAVEFREKSTLVLRPPASEPELEQLRKQLKSVLPEDIVSLLRRTAGFEFGPLATEVDFLGGHPFEVEDAFPNGLPLLGDGYSNFWIIDVIPGERPWGAVFYVCHDPGAVIVQAADLSQFLEQIFDLGRRGHRSALDYVRDEALRHVARKNPYLVPRSQCLGVGDAVVANFAESLPERFKLADLRACELGTGFSFGTSAAIRRAGHELVFGIET